MSGGQNQLRGLLCQVISLFVEDPHYGARRPRVETKPGSDFKYDTLMGLGVPSAFLKDRLRRFYGKCWVAAAFQLKCDLTALLRYYIHRRASPPYSPLKVGCLPR